MTLNDEDVREILRIIDESDLAEIKVETPGLSLHVRRASGDTSPAPPRLSSADQEDVSAEATVTINSPMLGTFYRAEGPGREPFVDVGSEVGRDSTVCIIEVMKMMNSIPARIEGTVVEVLAENAELVEYGQPLFRVHPK